MAILCRWLWVRCSEIDVTGEGTETHFHVFGSLAILAFYKDISVLLTATWWLQRTILQVLSGSD